MTPSRQDLLQALGQIQNHPACVNQDIMTITGCGMTDDEVRQHIESQPPLDREVQFRQGAGSPAPSCSQSGLNPTNPKQPRESPGSGAREMSRKIILNNVADYHATKAMAAYLSGEMDVYCYHIAIADRLWAKVARFAEREAA